jgi:blue copper oxidase
MRLPPFDTVVPCVRIRPDGANGQGKFRDALAKLPTLPTELPPVSQQLIMNMFHDEEGMKPLREAGLMKFSTNGKQDSETVARVTRLIVDQAQLSEATQLSFNGVNGKPFALNEPGFSVQRNKTMRWRISEESDRMLHPVHIHGCQFRVLTENGRPPDAHRAGWKDIAPISRGSFSDILVTFPHVVGSNAPYMAHCHILEHEDTGMMTQFTVV